MKYFNVNTIRNQGAIMYNYTYLQEIKGFKPLSKREVYSLFRNKDVESNNKIISHNLQFVVSMSKFFSSNKLELVDLISYGNEGLIEAVKRFDVETNNSFLTYARYWIIKYMLKVKTIKTPIKITDTYHFKSKKILKFIDDFEVEFGGTPSSEYIKQELGLNPVYYINTYDSEVSELHRTDLDPFYQSDLKIALKDVMNTLTNDEFEVVSLKFFKNMPIDLIAKEIGVSPSWAQKILQSSLQKMNVDDLRVFL